MLNINRVLLPCICLTHASTLLQLENERDARLELAQRISQTAELVPQTNKRVRLMSSVFVQFCSN